MAETGNEWWQDEDMWGAIGDVATGLLDKDKGKGGWVQVKQDPSVVKLFNRANGYFDKPSDVRGGLIGMMADKFDHSASGANNPFGGMSLLDVPGGEAMSQGKQPSFFGGGIDPETGKPAGGYESPFDHSEWTDMMRKFARGESEPGGPAPEAGGPPTSQPVIGPDGDGWAAPSPFGAYNRAYGPEATGGVGRNRATDVDEQFGPNNPGLYVPTPDGGLSKRPDGGWEGATLGELWNGLTDAFGSDTLEFARTLGDEPGSIVEAEKQHPGIMGAIRGAFQWAKNNWAEALKMGLTTAMNPMAGGLLILRAIAQNTHKDPGGGVYMGNNPGAG